jgi:glucokinase
LNDFEAVGYGCMDASVSDLITVRGGLSDAEGTRVVVGPGTGLGVCALTLCGKDWRVVASEAGHTAFPMGTNYADVIEKVVMDTDFVSSEFIISGDGLVRVYHAVCALDGVEPVEDITPPQILMLVEAGEKTSINAARIWLYFLGCVAGDIALSFRATGGVYLVGNILRTPEMTQLLKTTDDFQNGFEEKGNFSPFMRTVSMFLNAEDDLAFRGLVALLSK